MQTQIFHLKIISVKDILVHEDFDENRAAPLVDNLKKEQYLSNPILVASLGNSKYLQLDGMNRFCAFKRLGLSAILAQIIDYNDQETVELSSWIHLFTDRQNKFMKYLKKIKEISLKKGNLDMVGHRYIREDGTGRLCTVVTDKNEVFLLYANDNLSQKVNLLRKVVSFYQDGIVRDVLPDGSERGQLRLPFAEHPNTDTMVIFPTFTRHQIVDVVKLGGLFPSGITRHIIKRRCLNVKVPLSLFLEKSLVKQNEELEKILELKKFRVYEEPTVYFE